MTVSIPGLSWCRKKPILRKYISSASRSCTLLAEESSYLAENLASLYHADKMNVAAIGNLVPQLHIHHVVRYQADKAWPAPVWGKFAAIPYTAQQITHNIAQVKEQLKMLVECLE